MKHSTIAAVVQEAIDAGDRAIRARSTVTDERAAYRTARLRGWLLALLPEEQMAKLLSSAIPPTLRQLQRIATAHVKTQNAGRCPRCRAPLPATFNQAPAVTPISHDSKRKPDEQ